MPLNCWHVRKSTHKLTNEKMIPGAMCSSYECLKCAADSLKIKSWVRLKHLIYCFDLVYIKICHFILIADF